MIMKAVNDLLKKGNNTALLAEEYNKSLTTTEIGIINKLILSQNNENIKKSEIYLWK